MPELVCPIYHLSYPVLNLLEDLTGRLRLRSGEPLGVGEFSDFYTANHEVQGLPEVVAVKAFRGSHLRDKEYIDRFGSTLERCVGRWVTLDHKNVAKCYGYTKQSPLPALVIKYYAKGNIIRFLNNESPSFDDRLLLVRDIAQGLEYLHSQEQPIVHGDLRGVNIFVDDDRHAVLSDYELRHVIDRSNFTTTKPAGPVRWMAPELSLGDDEDDGPHFTTATDIFAFAMTVIEIFTGDVPFTSRRSDMAVARMISEGRRPDVPEEINNHQWFSELLQRCWNEDPAVRPTASQVVDALTVRFRHRR
ncbi:kinase-like domain-containing protein [Amanita rubescens]|nr:kinase-like domain-containing protein [Amanita rubescens]